MDLTNLIDRIDTLEKELRIELPNLAKGALLTIKALAELEIQEKGFGASYSPNEVRNSTLRKNLLNNRGRDFLDKRDKKGQKVTSYSEFRKAQGLQNRYVDLTYTGKMWAGMTVTKETENSGLFIAVLGSSSQIGAFKMDKNFERYGDYIAKVTSQQDITDVAEYVNEEVINIIKKVFE
jgi:hypothetical protein